MPQNNFILEIFVDAYSIILTELWLICLLPVVLFITEALESLVSHPNMLGMGYASVQFLVIKATAFICQVSKPVFAK